MIDKFEIVTKCKTEMINFQDHVLIILCVFW